MKGGLVVGGGMFGALPVAYQLKTAGACAQIGETDASAKRINAMQENFIMLGLILG